MTLGQKLRKRYKYIFHLLANIEIRIIRKTFLIIAGFNYQVISY